MLLPVLLCTYFIAFWTFNMFQKGNPNEKMFVFSNKNII